VDSQNDQHNDHQSQEPDFELNRAYGFTKFIIVVPSIAIKEGVYKALQMTEKLFPTGTAQ